LLSYIIGLFAICCTIGVGALFNIVRKTNGNGSFVCTFVFTTIIMVLIVLCIACNTIWYTVDWIRVVADAFKDGNGVALKDW